MSTKKIGFRPLKKENNKRNYVLDSRMVFIFGCSKNEIKSFQIAFTYSIKKALFFSYFFYKYRCYFNN